VHIETHKLLFISSLSPSAHNIGSHVKVLGFSLVPGWQTIELLVHFLRVKL